MEDLPDECTAQILEKVLQGVNYFTLGRVCRKWSQLLPIILPNLMHPLDFSNTNITDSAIKKLVGICHINLRNCVKITTTSLTYLTNIQSINLTNCYINGRGFRHLTKCQTLIFRKPEYQAITHSETITSLCSSITSLSLTKISFD